MSQELLGSKVTQGLVGAERVVRPLSGFKFAVEVGDRERAGGDLIKLLQMSAVRPLHPAIELR